MNPRPIIPSRPTAASRPAFSLLELMIVLTIMVAMAALSFPRLTRPLTESDAQRAANVLREEIADCRQAAMVGGEPMFLRLESSTGTIAWGGWTTLMAGEFEGIGDGWQPESTAVADRGTAGGGLSGVDGNLASASAIPRSNAVSLPAGMVVTEVRWTPVLGDTAVSSGDGSLAGDASLPGESLSGETLPAGQRFYLPFLPSGRTRNAVIVVLDTTTGSRAGIEVDAVTGMLRTIRLPAIRAVDLPSAGGAASSGGDPSSGGDGSGGQNGTGTPRGGLR